MQDRLIDTILDQIPNSTTDQFSIKIDLNINGSK